MSALGTHLEGGNSASAGPDSEYAQPVLAPELHKRRSLRPRMGAPKALRWLWDRQNGIGIRHVWSTAKTPGCNAKR